MRRKFKATVAVLLAGAGVALGQGRGATPAPTAMMPSGMYNGVSPAGGQEAMMMPPGGPGGPGAPMPMGGPPGGMPMGGPPMGGMPMGDPSGGLMGGMPTYPPQGYQGEGGGGGSNGMIPRWWVNADYMLMFISSQPARQPFVTTSAPSDGGVIGQPTTRVLYSTDRNLDVGLFSGFRIMGGWYKDADYRCGFEFGGFLSENKTEIFNASSDGNGVPTIARPFNIAGGGNGVFTVANLGQAAGSIVVANTSRFWGAEGNFLNNIWRSCPGDGCFWNIDGLLGVRFFQLREDLTFDSSSTVLSGGATFVGQPVTAGGTILVRDEFEGLNRFYGGQVGLKANASFGRYYFNAVGKVAFGLMHQTVDVNGNTTLQDAGLGINATASGGLYATSANIGNYTNDEFAVIPEVNLTLGYHWCSWFSTYVGYNGLYVDRVARPGNAIPLAVNPSLVPASNNFGVGAVNPVPNTSVTQSDFWIQGVTFGFKAAW